MQLLIKSCIQINLFLLVVLLIACNTEQPTTVGSTEEKNIDSLPQQLNLSSTDSFKTTTKYTALEDSLLQLGFKDVTTLPLLIDVSLGYTTQNNFTGKVLYDSLQHAFLHPLAFEKLKQAQILLKEEHPDYSFQVFDALRPRSTQLKMWEVVKNTPMQKYVANPYTGSIHNYGCAIDLTIINTSTNEPLDMGTEIDHLGRTAEFRYNQQLLKDGMITAEAVKNRILLRRIMKQAGFQPINSEWWHFNAFSNSYTKTHFTIIE